MTYADQSNQELVAISWTQYRANRGSFQASYFVGGMLMYKTIPTNQTNLATQEFVYYAGIVLSLIG